jgi:hypothetical protein
MDETGRPHMGAIAAALRDPLSFHILEVVERAEDVSGGRGPDLPRILDGVVRETVPQRAQQGRLGVESRLRQLVKRQYLVQDRWGAYHITELGWVEGLERPHRAFTHRG